MLPPYLPSRVAHVDQYGADATAIRHSKPRS